MPIQATKDDVVLSGHGAVDVGTGETAIPGGFELVVLAPPGASISDRLGGMIERGEKVNKLKLPTRASGNIDFDPIVYSAGKMAPNYVLYPPTGLVLKPGGPAHDRRGEGDAALRAVGTHQGVPPQRSGHALLLVRLRRDPGRHQPDGRRRLTPANRLRPGA
jgi:Putative adhesin Stv domain